MDQVRFRDSCLEAVFHRGLHLVLELRAAHTVEKKIGVATDVLDRWERDLR